MPDDDLDYFQRRAETELTMAQRSETRGATAAHYKLAEEYLARVEALGASATTETGQPGGEASADIGGAAAGLVEGRARQSREGLER